MSNRTLIEINHDFAGRIDDEFTATLRDYLRSANAESAAWLKQYGVTVVGMRHHTGRFIIDSAAEGFPAQYLTPAKAQP